MEIRLANTGDLPEILTIYAHARSFMAEHGNPNQWNDGYPDEELLIGDIENERLFLVMEGGIAAGVFMFFLGDEPTYQIIREGRAKCAPLRHHSQDSFVRQIQGRVCRRAGILP